MFIFSFLLFEFRNRYFDHTINNKNSYLSNLLIQYTQKLNTLPDFAKIEYRNFDNLSILNKIFEIDLLLKNDRFKNFYDNHDNSDEYYFSESRDFICSVVTLSDWYDELKDGNSMGLVVKVNTNELLKMGIMIDLRIDSVTTTFMPVTDYLSSTIKYFEKDKWDTDNDFGNLNNAKIVNDEILGEGNIVIPIYINKYHWTVSKILLKPILGLALAHNPFGYIKSYDSLIFKIFSEMLRMTFVNKNFKIHDKWARTLVIFSRTCAQLCFDHKYQRGLNKYISNFINDPILRINKLAINFKNIISQTVSTGYKFNNEELNKIIRYYLEEVVTNFLKNKKYDKNYINFLLTSGIDVSKELESCITFIEKDIQNELQMAIAFLKSNYVFNQFYDLYGKYNNYIKKLEETYSFLENDKTEKLIKLISTERFQLENITFKELYKMINCPDKMMIDLTSWIIQGSIRTKDKYRIMAVNKKIYFDPIKESKINDIISVDMLLNRFKSLK